MPIAAEGRGDALWQMRQLPVLGMLIPPARLIDEARLPVHQAG